MGNTNRLLNDLPKALECFDQALRIAQALGDKFRQGRALELTGDVYASSGKFENTLRSYEEALQLYQDLSNLQISPSKHG